MSAAEARPYITAEAYLLAEAASDQKHEYVNGEIYAMAGGSRRHGIIGANILGLLHAALGSGPCTAYTSDTRVVVPATGLRTYPDVTVVCGPDESDPLDPDALPNPTLLVQILSPSTEAYDRGDKFAHYRLLPSLREYVLIAQDRPHVEVYRREGGRWVLSDFDGLEAVAELTAVRARLPLSGIYRRVDFAEPVRRGPMPA